MIELTQTDKKVAILEMRAKGYSFSRIAKEVGVAKQTAVDVCRDHREELARLEALFLEELYETQRITVKQRIESLSSLMRKLMDEINTRDLKDVSTEKLVDLYIKTEAALKEEMIEPVFKSTSEVEQSESERNYLDSLTETPSRTKSSTLVVRSKEVI